MFTQAAMLALELVLKVLCRDLLQQLARLTWTFGFVQTAFHDWPAVRPKILLHFLDSSFRVLKLAEMILEQRPSSPSEFRKLHYLRESFFSSGGLLAG